LKKKGVVTLQRLWAEHADAVGERAHRYSQFAELYRAWKKAQKRSMRLHHRAGEKVFIDHAGPTVPVIDRRTGEIRTAQVLVAVLGASCYTFAPGNVDANAAGLDRVEPADAGVLWRGARVACS